MSKIKLVLEYDGGNYHGFQIQKNAHTIQAELERAIYKLSKERSPIVCAGRTDAGVHAWGQVAAFDSVARIPAERWRLALNSLLPPDIRILSSSQVREDFNPRFDALGKRYQYIVCLKREKTAFWRRYALCLDEDLEVAAMREAAGYIEGKHNFKAFCASGSSAHTFEREVSDCVLREAEPGLILNISGNGFLYNMVRIVMGTLLEVGRGKYPPDHMKAIIAAQDRTKAGPTVAPQGLYLDKVFY